MFKSFFKPRWQKEKVETRLAAVPDLDAQGTPLITLATLDASDEVRQAAIRRLSHLPTLIAMVEKTDRWASFARQRLVDLVVHQSAENDTCLLVLKISQGHSNHLASLVRSECLAMNFRLDAARSLNDEMLRQSLLQENLDERIKVTLIEGTTDLSILRAWDKQEGAQQRKTLRKAIKQRINALSAAEAALEEAKAIDADLQTLIMQDVTDWGAFRTQLVVLQRRWVSQKMHADSNLLEKFAKGLESAQHLLKSHDDELLLYQNDIEQRKELIERDHQLLLAIEQSEDKEGSSALIAELESSQDAWLALAIIPEFIHNPLAQQWASQRKKIDQWLSIFTANQQRLTHFEKLVNALSHRLEQENPLQHSDIEHFQTQWKTAQQPSHLKHDFQEKEQRFFKQMDALKKQLALQSQQRKESQQRLDELWPKIQSACEQEKFSEALNNFREAETILQTKSWLLSKSTLKKQRERLFNLKPQLNTMRHWRQWSTDQAREQLIEDAKALQGESEINPEERAHLVRQLREGWKKLVELDSGNHKKLWTMFDEIVTGAYEPSRQHFKKEADGRSRNLLKRQSICEEMEALPTEYSEQMNPDWKAIFAQSKRIHKAWAEAGGVDRKVWNQIRERFMEASKKLDQYLEPERQYNWQQREKLLEKAKCLLTANEGQAISEEHLEQAKALQKRWKVTVPSAPAQERRLWNEFRASMDAIFAARSEQLQRQNSESQSAYRAQTDLLTEMRNQIAAAQDSNHLQQEWERLLVRFNEQDPSSFPEKTQKHLKHLLNQQTTAFENKLIQLKHQQLEQQLISQEQVEITEAQTGSEEAAETGERLCLQLETLLDLPTPIEYKQQRMDYQISQLSEAMITRKTQQEKLEQGLTWLQDWHRLHLSAGCKKSQLKRMIASRQAIFAQWKKF